MYQSSDKHINIRLFCTESVFLRIGRSVAFFLSSFSLPPPQKSRNFYYSLKIYTPISSFLTLFIFIGSLRWKTLKTVDYFLQKLLRDALSFSKIAPL